LNTCGGNGNRGLAIKILSHLTKTKIIGKSQEKSETVYKPKSYQDAKIVKILNDLTKSKDKLWADISSIK
jgi:hypothetical protein